MKMKQASKQPSICTFCTDAGFAPIVCNYTYTLCSFCNKLPHAVGYICYQPIKAHFSCGRNGKRPCTAADMIVLDSFYCARQNSMKI